MIGVFDYTVILTYLSLISAVTGLILGFNGDALGAVICILICGFCDMFDGKVARTKKNRTPFEKDFGVQIDSLSDLVAFGVLPVAIGYGVGFVDYYFIPIYCIFVLAGLIRLAYFNSLELENERKNKNGKKGYIGLPITASTLVCPFLYIFRKLSWFKYLYAGALLVVALLYVSKIKISKPNNKVVVFFIVLGIIELALVFVGYLW